MNQLIALRCSKKIWVKTRTFGGGGCRPDVCAGNPLIGSRSARVMQIGLKLTF